MTTQVKAPPTAQVVVAMFDSHGQRPTYREVRRCPIGDFTPLTLGDYRPDGGTPLRDATMDFIEALGAYKRAGAVTVGLLLDESGSMLGNRDAVIRGANDFVAGMVDVDGVDHDVDSKVLAVIFTDGGENSSRRTSPELLRQTTVEREAQGWTFIFCGANQDAWATGADLGLSGGASGQSVNFRSTPKGTSRAMASLLLDACAYLSSNNAYVSHRASTAKRSLTEDGEELPSNTGATWPSRDMLTPREGASHSGAGAVPDVTIHVDQAPAGPSLYDVADALRRARRGS